MKPAGVLPRLRGTAQGTGSELQNLAPNAFAGSGSVCVVTNSSILMWIRSLEGKFLNTAVFCKADTKTWSLISEGICSLMFPLTTSFAQAQFINQGNLWRWQYVAIAYKLGQVYKNTSVLENLSEALMFERNKWGKKIIALSFHSFVIMINYYFTPLLLW